jgi:hypothetical protein
VIAVLPDGLMRQAFENDVVEKLQKKGRTVLAGSDIPGLRGGIRGKIDTEAATKALQAAGVDGVIVMFYAGGATKKYSRSPYYAQYEGTVTGFSAYNWGQPSFINVYSVQKGDARLNFQKDVLVESSYYDLETREPIWRIVTQTKDLEHSNAAAEIGKKIASQMRSSGQ